MIPLFRLGLREIFMLHYKTTSQVSPVVKWTWNTYEIPTMCIGCLI